MKQQKRNKLSEALLETQEKIKESWKAENGEREAQTLARRKREAEIAERERREAMVPAAALAVCWHYRRLIKEEIIAPIQALTGTKQETTIRRHYCCKVPEQDLVFPAKNYSIKGEGRGNGYYSNSNGISLEIKYEGTKSGFADFFLVAMVQWSDTYYSDPISRIVDCLNSTGGMVQRMLENQCPYLLDEFLPAIRKAEDAMFNNHIEAEKGRINKLRETAEELEKVALSTPSMLEVIARGDELGGN